MAETILGEADMPKMEVDHSDLMKRINDTEDIEPQPPMDKIPRKWKDFAKQYEQNRCFEGSIKVATIKRLFHKIFKKEKS